MERVKPSGPFEVDYESLEEDAPTAGRIALLPWDSNVFGFPVADYRLGEEQHLEPATLARKLSKWEERYGVSLVSCRVSAHRAALGDALSTAGFRFIELQLRATLPRLRAAKLTASRLTVRAAVPNDRARLLAISETAFRFGRYHADARFPRALADRRYRAWLEAALDSPSQESRVYVVGPAGRPGGFLHTTVRGHLADFRLAGVDPEDSGIAGPELFLGTLKLLAAEGIEQVTGRLSAANTSAVNLYASLFFRFHEPELVFHRGQPRAGDGTTAS